MSSMQGIANDISVPNGSLLGLELEDLGTVRSCEVRRMYTILLISLPSPLRLWVGVGGLLGLQSPREG